MLQFVQIIHCFCIKRTAKTNIAVDPSTNCIISLGNMKQLDIKIREGFNHSKYDEEEKGVLKHIYLHNRSRGWVKILGTFCIHAK